MSESRVPAGVPTGGQFAASARAESTVTLEAPRPEREATTAEDALAPALDMNRVEAERHVRSLIDDAAAAGDPQRIDQIASLASGRGWAGVAYVRGYPSTGNPESQPTDYLPTKAAATRVAEHAWSRTVEAERRAQDGGQRDEPTQEWLPPGAHQIVNCLDCAADPARRDQPGCRYCDHGRVRTDRYGQRPWNPDKPGTQVGFEVRRGDDVGWQSAIVTASGDTRHLRTSTFTPNYVLAIPAGGPEAREVGIRTMLPVPAAQAAARHGVSRPEMIEEAAHDMSIGIDPTHEEVLAFLDRISPEYLDDLGRAAADYRTSRAAELRDEGKTGPALDRTFDAAALRPGDLDRAIDGTPDAFRTQFEVAGRDHWHGYTVVYDDKRGFCQTYNDTAWTEPDEQPLLPWSPPVGTPVAHVALDGTVTRIDQPEENSR